MDNLIFLSHSSKDEVHVSRIYEQLTEKGFPCWVDLHNILPGAPYAQQIMKGISECPVFLLLISEHSIESQDVLNELDCASRKKKMIIPLFIKDVDLPDDFMYYISRTQWLKGYMESVNAVEDICSVIRQSGIFPQGRPDEVERQSQNQFSVHTGKEITVEMISEAIELDHMVYPAEYWADLDTCLKWRDRNADIYIMVKDNTSGHIVGYLNIMPVYQETFEKMMSGDVIDVSLIADDLAMYDLPDCMYLYISSAVTHPAYRHSAVLRYLLDAFYSKLIKLSEDGIYFKEMFADAVSPEGEKLCRYAGMQQRLLSEHGSKLFSVLLLPPKIRPTTQIARKLFSIYDEYQKIMEKYNL